MRAANAHANALQALARQLSTAADLGQVLEAGRRALSTALDADVWLRLEQRESEPPSNFAALDRSAADWTQRHGQPAAASPTPWPGRSGGACRCAMSAVHWASLRCAFVRACNGPVWNSAAWPKRWWKTSARLRYAPAWSPIWKAHV